MLRERRWKQREERRWSRSQLGTDAWRDCLKHTEHTARPAPRPPPGPQQSPTGTGQPSGERGGTARGVRPRALGTAQEQAGTWRRGCAARAGTLWDGGSAPAHRAHTPLLQLWSSFSALDLINFSGLTFLIVTMKQSMYQSQTRLSAQ